VSYTDSFYEKIESGVMDGLSILSIHPRDTQNIHANILQMALDIAFSFCFTHKKRLLKPSPLAGLD
jgi:hypothetical protein